MRCRQNVKCRIAVAREAFNRMKRLLCGPLDIRVRKWMAKCFVWIVSLYELGKKRRDCRHGHELWTKRRMERISWKDRVTKRCCLEE